MNQINSSLLKILRCPITGEELEVQENLLISKISQNKYIIKNSIPVLLVEGLEKWS